MYNQLVHFQIKLNWKTKQSNCQKNIKQSKLKETESNKNLILFDQWKFRYTVHSFNTNKDWNLTRKNIINRNPTLGKAIPINHTIKEIQVSNIAMNNSQLRFQITTKFHSFSCTYINNPCSCWWPKYTFWWLFMRASIIHLLFQELLSIGHIGVAILDDNTSWKRTTLAESHHPKDEPQETK